MDALTNHYLRIVLGQHLFGIIVWDLFGCYLSVETKKILTEFKIDTTIITELNLFLSL